MLDPRATNRMSCTVCTWTKIIDHTREYRGGHTDPETKAECHGMLTFEQVEPPPSSEELGDAEHV